MSTLNIKVIVGSSRQNRFSEKPARWISGLAKQRADLSVETLDRLGELLGLELVARKRKQRRK